MKILSGSCAYRVIPQRAHCLTLAKVIRNILPSYIISLSTKQIRDILPISITVFYINTCLAKVTFVTSADGELRVLPGKPKTMDDCAKDGVEESLTRILCGIEEISQSNQSKFNMMQSIMVKNPVRHL